MGRKAKLPPNVKLTDEEQEIFDHYDLSEEGTVYHESIKKPDAVEEEDDPDLTELKDIATTQRVAAGPKSGGKVAKANSGEELEEDDEEEMYDEYDPFESGLSDDE